MPADRSEPAWWLRLDAELREADARAAALVRPLTGSQLNWTPRPDVWSVGQCLEHLCVSNEVYLDALAGSLGANRRTAVQQITPGPLSRWFIVRYIAPPSPQMKRATAPRKITPASSVEPAILDRFLRSNERIREFVERAKGYDVNRIRFSNPFLPVIRFSVGTGLEILSQHERRHLAQAERLTASADFPSG